MGNRLIQLVERLEQLLRRALDVCALLIHLAALQKDLFQHLLKPGGMFLECSVDFERGDEVRNFFGLALQRIVTPVKNAEEIIRIRQDARPFSAKFRIICHLRGIVR